MIQNSNILIYVLDKVDLATKQKTQRVGLQLFREKSQIRISSPQYHTDYLESQSTATIYLFKQVTENFST